MTLKIQLRGGGLALEAALIMPLVLLLAAFMINAISATIAETRLKAAMDRTAQEISLLVPLCDLVLSQVIDEDLSLADVGLENIRKIELVETIDTVGGQLWPGFSAVDIIADASLDLASSALLGPFIQQRINYWLRQADQVSIAWNSQIQERKLFLDFRLERQQLWLCQSYEITTVFGPVKRQLNVVVPLWIGSGEADPDDNDGIWSLDNFSRGQIIRQRMGANLPYDFPVIASFANGRATAIYSMDLTAPTYNSTQNISSRVSNNLNRLVSFSGTVYRRKDETITITAPDIRTREMIIVIPENSPQEGRSALNRLADVAKGKGVELRIVVLGRSGRYLNEDSGSG